MNLQSDFALYNELEEYRNFVFIFTDNRRCSLAYELATVSIHRDVGNRDAQADLEPKHRRPETTDWTSEGTKRSVSYTHLTLPTKRIV